MKKMIQIAILLFITTGCSVTEDCFKKTGDFVLQTIEVTNFDKIVVEKVFHWSSKKVPTIWCKFLPDQIWLTTFKSM